MVTRTARDGRRPSGRAGYATAAFAVYVAAIVASNWMISHVGIPAGPGGPHLTPVGFGLLAPSGVWAAAVSFPARDMVQRLTPNWHVRLPLAGQVAVPVAGLAAILVGAALSWAISDPRIAVASGVTYLCSETADFAVYTPLQRDRFAGAVFASGCVAAVVDSVLFLHLAGLPAGAAAVAGLILGKVWVQCAAYPVAGALRAHGPAAVAPA